MRRTDLAAASILALLAVLCLAWIVPQFTIEAQSELDLAPSLMPNIAMGVMLVLALLLGVLAYRRGSAETADDEEFGAEASGIGPRELRNCSIWAGASILFVVLLPVLGYMIAAALLSTAAMIYAGRRDYKLTLLTGIAGPVIIAQIAWYLFTVELPPASFLEELLP